MSFSRHPLRHLALIAVLFGAACGEAALPTGQRDGTPDAAPALAQTIATPTNEPAAVPADRAPADEATPSASEEAAASPANGGESADVPAIAPPPSVSPAAALQPVQPPAPLAAFLPAAGRPRVVVLDPGHGGPEVGAAGGGVGEKDVNLRIALLLRDLLVADGMRVVLTRDSDQRAAGGDSTGTGANSPTRRDLQERLDIANRVGADLFLSIHNNGSSNTGDSGTEVWWDGRRPFAAYNQALAGDILDALVGTIRGLGYPTINRGLKEDSNFRVFQGRAFPIFVLGPPRTGTTTSRAGLMPAVLGETLFLSNPAEAAQLTRPAMLAAIAQGYREGIQRYFARIESGQLAPPRGGFPAETPNFYDIRPPASASGSG